MRASVPSFDFGLDPVALRRDFPILAREVHPGRPLVYLDNASTTQKPLVVIEAMAEHYRETNANVHRAVYRLAEIATDAYEGARRAVARFIHAPNEHGVIFTSGATASINLVAHAWGQPRCKAGDVILLTEMEHHSNLVPWQMLAARTGATLAFVPVNDIGELELESLDRLLTPRVRLFAFTHVSNVLGTVNPVRDLITRAHAVGAAVLLDAAQSVPHMPVDCRALDCDFLVFSGHKMCGPTGIGVLAVKPERLEEMDPFLGGGEMISRVTLEQATWAEPPHKFEAGTPHVAGAVGLGAAVAYLEGIGLEAIHAYERALAAYVMARLETVPGLRIHGRATARSGVVSFSLEGAHPHDIAQLLDQDGVAIRGGHLCAQPLMRKRGVPALNRASFYFYNTRDDVDALVRSVLRAQEFFARANG